MRIKILNPLNDVLHVGRVTDVSKDVALLLIKQGDAEAYNGAEPEPVQEPVQEPQPVAEVKPNKPKK